MADEMGKLFEVEAAPTEFGLKELLGLDDTQLDAGSSSGGPSVNEDDLIEITNPHIKVPAKKIDDMVKVANIIAANSKNSTSVENKCLCFHMEDGKLVVRASNRVDIWAEATMDTLNENTFDDVVVITVSTLAKMLRVCSSVFILEKRDDGFFVHMVGGDAQVDAIGSNLSYFMIPKTDEGTPIKVKKAELCSSIKRLFPLASSGSISKDKNIYFDGTMSYAVNMYSAAKITTESNFGKFALPYFRARLLYLLASIDSGAELTISGKGYIYAGEDFKLKISETEIKEQKILEVLDRMLTGPSASTDISHLARITTLSSGLDYSMGKLRFNVEPDSDGRIHCEMLTKRKNGHFTLRGSASTLEKLENDVELSSSSLAKLVSVFNGDQLVDMRLSDDGISFQDGPIVGALCSESVGI